MSGITNNHVNSGWNNPTAFNCYAGVIDMSYPYKTFMVYSVCKIDFKNKTYDNIRFFKAPKDAELLRGDLATQEAENPDVMFVVEYCDRSEIL